MLEGKTAIVTGGSRGIGLAVAQAMLAEGASVVISGTDQARLRDAQRQLETTAPGRVASMAADVRSTPDVAKLVGTAVDRFAGLDILINNAAFRRPRQRGVDGRRHVAEGHRHQPDRRLSLLPRGDSAHEGTRWRLDPQHQQPGGEELRSSAARRTARRRRG
jgi:NAD(P)-dependent dehydrogenase (short-subunit alcohol dehydrogenase family)